MSDHYAWNSTWPLEPSFLDPWRRVALDSRFAGRNYHIGLWIPNIEDIRDDQQFHIGRIVEGLNKLSATGGQEWGRRDILSFPEPPSI